MIEEKVLSEKNFQAVKGMRDVLPSQISYWDFLETVMKQVAVRYGYKEIRFPILESTGLFERTIGTGTDIVEKEMYTFDDHGESLTLRPEGTAGCVRAVIENGLIHNQIQRLWYTGPMFRHEKPQKNRYRQFYHFGVEAFGMQGPDIDAEQILMAARIWHELGIKEQLSLQLNSLGSAATRAMHREKLVAYFKQHESELDQDSLRRLNINPLRILDSKNPQMQELIKHAPRIIDFLDAESKQHFDGLRRILDAANLSYSINPYLVRGLDYYCLTVYEWVAVDSGSQQNTVCAGGRYDGLVSQLGGQATPAVGFAAGLERIVTLLERIYTPESKLQLYFILVGEDNVVQHGLLLAEKLRSALPNLTIMVNCGDGSFKSQFKRADKSGAKWALILGEEEFKSGKIALKNLRHEEPQQMLTIGEVVAFFS